MSDCEITAQFYIYQELDMLCRLVWRNQSNRSFDKVQMGARWSAAESLMYSYHQHTFKLLRGERVGGFSPCEISCNFKLSEAA